MNYRLRIRSRTRSLYHAFPVMLLITMFIVGCGTPGKNLPVTEATAAIGADQVQEVKVEVNSFYFKPSRINVLVSTPVRLILKNKALIIPHNISMDSPDAGLKFDKDIGAGRTVTVEFTPNKAGEYLFFCDKDGHKNKGMTGTIVVKER
jgi:plastocyanin